MSSRAKFKGPFNANYFVTDFCHPIQESPRIWKKMEGVRTGYHAIKANDQFSCLERNSFLVTSKDSFYYYFENSEIIFFFETILFFISVFIQSSLSTIYTPLYHSYRDLGPLIACTWFRRSFQLSI